MHNSNHESFLHYFRSKELDEIYIGNALRSFAGSMISIFIPIYLFTLGNSFTNILWFYLLTHLFGIGVVILSFDLIHRIGAKHLIFVSTIFQIGFFVLLQLMSTTYIPLAVLALVNAIHLYFFWLPFNIIFARSSSNKEGGTQLSIMTVFSSALTIIGPLVGGIITTQFSQGFLILFIFASILLLISGAVYLFSQDSKDVHKVNLRKSLDIISEKDKFALTGNRIRTFTLAILWPLFMFLILGTTVSIGAIMSGANLVLVALTAYVGRLSDKKDKNKLLRVGSIFHSGSAAFRGFATTIGSIATFQILGAFTFAFMNIPFRSMVYQRSREHSISAFMFSQEFFFRIVTIIFIACLIILTNFFTPIIVMGVAFMLAGFGTIMMNYMQIDRSKFQEKMA